MRTVIVLPGLQELGCRRKKNRKPRIAYYTGKFSCIITWKLGALLLLILSYHHHNYYYYSLLQLLPIKLATNSVNINYLAVIITHRHFVALVTANNLKIIIILFYFWTFCKRCICSVIGQLRRRIPVKGRACEASQGS